MRVEARGLRSGGQGFRGGGGRKESRDQKKLQCTCGPVVRESAWDRIPGCPNFEIRKNQIGRQKSRATRRLPFH